LHIVLFFSHGISMQDWHSAGILSREIRLYQEAVRRGITFTFITFGDKQDLQWQGVYPGIEIVPIFAGREKSKNRISLWLHSWYSQFWLEDKITRPDLVKTNQILGGLLAASMATRWKTPLLVQCGYEPYRFVKASAGSWWKVKFIHWYARTVYRSATRIHVATDNDKKYIVVQFFSRKKQPVINVHPNWVDTRRFRPIFEDSNRGSMVDGRVLAIGRPTGQKNFRLLIEAISMGSYGLDLITDLSPESVKLRQYAVKVGADVEFHSRVPHEELPEIYQGHQIYLITSQFEGHPKTLLEAMACGCAVIGTQTPGIEELIEDNVTGLLVAPTALAIHQAIVSLMADEKYRQRLGANAFKYVEQHCSLDRAIKDEIQAYVDCKVVPDISEER
jgi:glycosyltransferase involved in cell wall biosynthesis